MDRRQFFKSTGALAGACLFRPWRPLFGKKKASEEVRITHNGAYDFTIWGADAVDITSIGGPRELLVGHIHWQLLLYQPQSSIPEFPALIQKRIKVYIDSGFVLTGRLSRLIRGNDGQIELLAIEDERWSHYVAWPDTLGPSRQRLV